MKATVLLPLLLVLFALLQSTTASNSTETIEVTFLRPSVMTFNVINGAAGAFLDLFSLNITKEIQPV